MKANELMLGDWVLAHRSVDPYHDGVPFADWKQPGQIQKIEYGFVDVKFIDYPDAPTEEERCNVEDFSQKEIEPILLTEEILEANGFKEYIPGLNLMYGLGGPYIASNEEGNQWVFGLVKKDESARFPLVKITFVHELQHALRLCGIEKEIKL